MTGTALAGSRRVVVMALSLSVLLMLAAGALLIVSLYTQAGRNAGNPLAAAIGGPFHLVDQNGKAFTDANLKGKWHLVFFGYTHCPDVCPTTLNELSLALAKLDAKKRGEVDIVFITVDPARDTPDVLKSYAQSFDAPIVGLTGNAAEIKQAAQDYHVYYAKHPLPGGDYDMDHSAVVYVMDPDGHFSATISPDEAAAAIEAKLQKLVS